MLSAKQSAWLSWIFLAAAIFALLIRNGWGFARRWLRIRMAMHWPITDATIETFYVARMNPGDRRRGWINAIPVLQYSYIVAGERYSGSANLAVWESDQDSARAAGEGWIGEKIRVRYKPEDAATSIWLEQDGAPAGVQYTLPDGFDDSMIDLELNK